MSVIKDVLFIIVVLILFFVLRKNQFLKQELVNQRENFIKTLRHDLRVSAIAQIRALDLLQQEYSKGLVKDIADSCRYSLDMINILLNTYRYEQGEQILNHENVNIVDLITSSCSRLADVAEEKCVSFSVNMDSSENIYADQREFEKLMYYLLSTAVFYSDKNSSIAISVKKENDKLNVSLTYNGNTLSEEECRRMFLNNSRFSTVGHGIKMYMCKKIVEFHGGEIYVKNISDKINSFTFLLPVRGNTISVKHTILSRFPLLNL